MDTPRSQVSNRFKKAVKKVIAIDRLAFLNTLNVRTISQNSKEAIKEDEWEPRITKMKQLFNDPEKLLPCFAKSMNLNKINDDKFFIIKYGPPSSGKGTFVPIVTKDLNIKKLAEIIKNVTKYKGKIFFNKKYPDGVKVRKLDITRIQNVGWKHTISLKKGLLDYYNYFKKLNIN